MTDSPAPPSRRAHWTPARQRIFLVALLDGGSVAQAARAAGMSRSSAHRLRARLAGTAFVQAWDGVLAEHRRRLADPFAAPLPSPPSPSRPPLPSSPLSGDASRRPVSVVPSPHASALTSA